MELTKIEFFSAIGVLVSIISCFWIIIRTHSKKDSEKLDKFELLHEVNQKQITELEEEKKLLEADISSVATYLRHRRRIDGYKAKIRATRDTIRTMFELKADKVAAFS